jgi:DNA polymerase-3 subunit gamma/tau
LSRCLQFSLKRLSSSLIAERMKLIATAEKLDFEPAALAHLARAADGSMRDGLSLLDQLIAFGGGTLSEANTRAMLGTIDRGHVSRIVEALAREDGPGLLAQVGELDRDAPDYDRALADLAAFLQRIAIVQIVPDAAQEDEEFDAEVLARMSRSMRAEDLQLYYQIALAGRRDLSLAPDPRLGFEMTLLRMLAFRPDAPAAGTMAGSGAAAGAGRALPTPPAARAAPQATVTPIAPIAPAPSTVSAAPIAPAPAALVPASIDAASWPRIVEAAGLSGMVRQFALNCVPASFERDVLTLRLDEGVDARRSRAIEEKLLQALTKYLGRAIRLVFEVSQSELATPARQRALADQDKVVRAAAAFEADPVVKGLQERFGAAVDTASVKPGN